MKAKSSTFSILPVICVVIASLSTAHATVWVARHGLTGQQYQDEFDKWTGEGLRLRCVNGYTDAGATKFAAIWDNTPPLSGWGASHGMTAADFTQINANAEAGGQRAAYINMYESGGQLRYAAIWHAGSTDREARLGRTAAQFQSDRTQLAGAGFRLLSVTACTVGNTEYYAGIWNKLGPIFIQQQESHRRTPQQFQDDFNQWTAQGYRQAAVCACYSGGETRYTAIWRKPFGNGWWSYSDLSAANYQTETWNAYYQGCRPELVSVFTVNGTPRFIGMWTGNGGMPFDCLGIIDNGIRQYMQDNDTSAVSLAIVRNGRLVYAKGWGLADQSTNEWAGPRHRFRIASISKPITAAAVLKLIEANEFDLDDNVFGAGALLGTQYGNGSYTNWEEQITVRHLLTHTTGWTQEDPLWDNSYGTDHNAIMDWTLDSNSPSSVPGTKYQYMNLDYHALGRLIEQYSGQSYENYCRNAVLAPCGVTGMELGNQTLAGRKPMEVRYYSPGGGDPYSEIHPRRMDANGGWISTAIDLLLFLRRIDDDTPPADILNSTSRDEMRDGNATSAAMGYGLGWLIGNGTFEGHNGCMTGTSSFMIHRPTGTWYAVLANKRTNCSWELKGAVDAIIQQLETKNQWPTYNLFPPNSGYSGWLTTKFSNLNPDDGYFVDWTDLSADPDGDGQSNLSEAYFNTNPRLPNPEPEITVQLEPGTAIFQWRKSLSGYGVRGNAYLATDDLNDWGTRPLILQNAGSPPLAGFFETLQARINRTGRNGGSGFIRLVFNEE